MKRQLSQLQRLLVAGIYIFIIVMIYGLLNGGIADILNQSEAASVWFFSGILLIIMGMYVTEPYFSSPTDTLSNSISLILVLLAITNRQELNGYIELLVYAVCMFILSIFHMIVKNYNEKAKRISFWCLKHLGSSKTMFSVVYLVSAFSFFRDNTPMLFAAIALWICMVPIGLVVSDLLQEKIDELESQSMRTGTSDSKSSWGNVENFKKLMESAVSGFMDANNKSVMVLNPEKYIVRQAATDFRITELKDVSLVEKVQIISEIVLKKCMDLGQIDKARCCVVYEEAHSLTPEFNSVVVKDDNSHANGTAKVILQGRKYGLGCIIVTQRTANVTKSILNQCNTIFALRVFDDTGKSFLENYIGKDYSDTLPTLEERHAIAIGKGIGLKQPVILQLNDMKYLQTNEGEKE